MQKRATEHLAEAWLACRTFASFVLSYQDLAVGNVMLKSYPDNSAACDPSISSEALRILLPAVIRDDNTLTH